jgi:hypothetical protein
MLASGTKVRFQGICRVLISFGENGIGPFCASFLRSKQTAGANMPGWFAIPFPVRLFHSLLHAGLSRRYPRKSACAACFAGLTAQKR